MAVFSGLNCSGGFPDLFIAVLTGINPFLRFLYELSKKSSSLKNECTKVQNPRYKNATLNT